MQKNIMQIIMLLVIMFLSACQSDSADAKSSSSDIKEIYSNSSTLDETIPKSISVVAGESIYFTVSKNLLFNGNVGSYNDFTHYYSWQTRKKDVGQYIISFGNKQESVLNEDSQYTLAFKEEQNVTINVTSTVETPTITASQGEYSDRVNININTDVNYYNSYLFYSPTKEGTYISLEGNQHILNSSATILDYFYKVQIVDENGNYSLKSKPVKGYFASPIPSNVITSLDNKIGAVNLSWSIAYPNLENLTYNLFRDKNCDNIIDETVTGITTNSYIDENLTLGESYCYQISSIVNKRESERSYSSYSLDMKVPVPQNIGFTTTINSATLFWDKIVGVDRYKVYGSSSQYSGFSLLSSLLDNRYTDKNVNFNEIKYYKVVAVKDNIESDSDTILEVHILPAYPKNFTVSQGTYSDMIKLSWSKNSNVDSYTLYRATEIDGYYNTLEQNIAPDIEEYADIDADVNTTYFYKIVSVYNNRESNYSKIELGYYGDTIYNGTELKSKVPYNLKIEDGTLSWTEAEDVTTYNIYSSTSKDGNFSLDGNSSTLSYTPSNDKQFFYLKGVKADGNLTGATKVVYYIPTSPTVINISSNVDEVYLEWNATNATSYNIYKEIDNQYSLLATVEDTNYTDNQQVVFNSNIYYKITATFHDENSSLTDTSSIYEKVTIAPPKNLSVSEGEYSDKIVVSWNTNSKADSYTLYRATTINGGYSKIVENIVPTMQSYIDMDITVNTPYFYKIKSIYNGSESNYSEPKLGFYGEININQTFVDGFYGAYYLTSKGTTLYVSDADVGEIYKVTSDGRKTVLVTGLSNINGIAVDSFDNIYIANNNYSITKIDKDGRQTTLTSDLSSPRGIVIDSKDNIYVTDVSYDEVYKITQEGTKTTIATGFSSPYGITIDSDDNIYITDSGYDAVYKITQEGVKTTVATGFSSPYGIAIDSTNTLYVSDYSYDKLYKISVDGNKTTLVTGFSNPRGVTVDSMDRVYVSDTDSDIIYKLVNLKSQVPYNLKIEDGTLNWNEAENVISYNIYSSTSKDGNFSLDGNSSTLFYIPSNDKQFFYLKGVKADGNLTGATKVVYYIPTSPTVVNISSNVDEVYLDWNSTNATSYNIYKEIDSEYTLIDTVQTTRYTDINVTYSERYNYKITANFLSETSDITQTSNVSEYVTVQAPLNLVASNGQYSDRVILNWSANSKADSYSLYRATSVNGSYSKIVSSQNITRFEDSSASMETVYYYKIRSVYNNSYGDYSDIVTGSFGSTQLISTFSASINAPRGIAFDSYNNMYALDYSYNTIYKITPNGEKTIFVSDINYPYDIAIDSKDNIYISENSNNQVYKVTLTGEKTALNIDLGEPKGLAIDSENSLYIVDYSYNKVHKIDTEGSVSTFKTALNSPKAITIDALDNVYISDSVNDKIYRYKANGTDETEFVSGVSQVGYITVNSDKLYISADGNNSVYKVDSFGNREKIASYSTPTGIGFDSENNLYIADDYNNDIYKYTISKSVIPYNLVLNDSILSWNKADDAISYEIFSSSSEDGTYSVLKDSIETLSYTLDSTGEYYKVRAKFLDGSYSSLTYEVH